MMTTQRSSVLWCCWLQVEDMRRKDLYRRDNLLQKIQGETAKARAVLTQRAALQEARKQVGHQKTLPDARVAQYAACTEPAPSVWANPRC